MKALAIESSGADTHFQQLDKLRIVYEEYVKIGKETIPHLERNLAELTEELDQKSLALDDVTFYLKSLAPMLALLDIFMTGAHLN